MKSQAHSFAVENGFGEPAPAGDGHNGTSPTCVMIDEVGDFDRAAAAVDAAVERAVYLDLAGYPNASQGLSDFVRDSVKDQVLLHGTGNDVPLGILSHVHTSNIDPAELKSEPTRQARRAAEREARKLLDRRIRTNGKKVAIAQRAIRVMGKRVEAGLHSEVAARLARPVVAS